MTGVAEYLEYSNQGNTRRKFLKEQLMMQEHNLFRYSSNLLLLDPKRGYEKHWEEALEKVRLVTQMYNELPDESGCCVFVGRILEWMQSNNGWLVKFEVASPERSLRPTSILYYFKISDELVQEWQHAYEDRMKERTDAELPTLVKSKVKKAFIYGLECVDRWD